MTSREPRGANTPNILQAEAVTQRVFGSVGSDPSGPLLIVVAGIHGNEKAGVIASRRVLARIREESIPLYGRLVMIAGNMTALERHVRFIDTDLNRMWRSDEITALLEKDPESDGIEEREQRELLATIDAVAKDHRGSVVILDAHSTSADAPPFCIISDTLQNRRIAFALSIPVILGLEEAILGTIQEHFSYRGFVTGAIEGGQHDDPVTADRLESALWIVAAASHLIDETHISDLEGHRRHLRMVSRGLPRVVEVTHRRARKGGDGFRMRDGFANFSPIRKGQVLAHDSRGEIRAEADGMLVLPSYQPIGDDGYFIGRNVRRIWLRVSTMMRKLRLDRVLHWLPGVRRHPSDEVALLADPDVTRWLALKIFHLCGFRKCVEENGLLCFRRRPEGPGFVPRRSVNQR